MNVIPMDSKSEVTLALKQFGKEIGSPEAIIMNAYSEKKSQEVKQFIHRIGTALRVSEKGTPWNNRQYFKLDFSKKQA